MRDWLKVVLAVVASIVVVLLIGWGLWAIRVGTSETRGIGDGIIKKNSAENWTAAQAEFEKNYAGIKSADKKITLAAQQAAANPNDKTYQQTYAGVVSGCLNLVADYNADSRKYLSEDFKSADLPHQIDESDPTTDCKEDK